MGPRGKGWNAKKRVHTVHKRELINQLKQSIMKIQQKIMMRRTNKSILIAHYSNELQCTTETDKIMRYCR